MAEKRKALGRGLAALLGEAGESVPAQPSGGGRASKPDRAEADSNENSIVYIDIDDIKPNKSQPRMRFDSEAIEELAASVETHGVLQPVILRKAEFGYELVAGERRWRAARKAGLRVVPSIVREIGEEENALIALIENVQREDLNAAEEAHAFAAIIESRGLTQEELARAVGKSRSYIANTLRILKLPEPVISMLREGGLSAGHANALGMLKDEKEQIAIAERVVRQGLSVRETERICSASAKEPGTGRKKTRKALKKSAEIIAVEEELTSSYGAKVLIVPEKKGGKIELRYHNKDGLNDLIDLLRKNV